MIRTGAVLLLLAFASADMQTAPPSPRAESVTVRHQQIIIRLSRGSRSIAPAGASLIRWRETRGPRCVTAQRLVGATSLRPDSVDLILRDNSRIRARLQRRCPAIDFYRGFYVEPRDQRLCARRDTLRSRMGGTCEIRRFRSLTPHPKR